MKGVEFSTSISLKEIKEKLLQNAVKDIERIIITIKKEA
jgi:hypothetical protein